jgi:muramoyltetrapeptide carboxypeptidase LdcA involved in peptidoglycan recycling
VTSPSAGVEGAGARRIDFCVSRLREAGFDVVVGRCMDGAGITSGPAADRAAELTAMLCDPAIRCVVPPWGGDTAIDLLDLLDWDALEAADPTWLVGYSDLSTILLPITTRLGWATLHGDNVADTPYQSPDGLLPWLDIASGPGPHRQRDSGLVADWWPFAEDDAATICRNLHGLRLAGWFEHARAILVGRTRAPDNPTLTQREAVLDALGRLELPIVLDLEIGHVPPHLPLVNGAMATVTVDGGTREVVQELS